MLPDVSLVFCPHLMADWPMAEENFDATVDPTDSPPNASASPSLFFSLQRDTHEQENSLRSVREKKITYTCMPCFDSQQHAFFSQGLEFPIYSTKKNRWLRFRVQYRMHVTSWRGTVRFSKKFSRGMGTVIVPSTWGGFLTPADGISSAGSR